jgi:heat shock transcription factor 2
MTTTNINNNDTANKDCNAKTNNDSRTNQTMTVPTAAKKSFAVTDASQDIPIFLRKTYHMVDTCDTAVCSWSEDGETFVVKHPKKFEQEIIPQFFKHSKFSSFVRQLNFYAFRKIKTNDSIRIDAALEAATANYWRFFHPKFQRGKPEWLQEIKRSSSTPRGSGNSKKASAGGQVVIPDVAASGNPLGQEKSELKSEVTILKERIEAMNKNIDMLTTMVQNVSMAQKAKTEDEDSASPVNQNNKRAKTALQPPACVPDEISSSIEVPDAAPSMPSPVSLGSNNISPQSNPLKVNNTRQTDLFLRETSQTSDLSDEGFVDTLFTAFKGDEDGDDVMGDVIDLAAGPDIDTESMKLNDSPWLNSSPFADSTSEDAGVKKQRPRAELMNRLSDALSLLPREIQELIVDRLIQAITSPKEIRESLQVTEALKDVVSNATADRLPTSVPQSPRHVASSCDDSALMTDDDRSTAAASVVPALSPTTPSPKSVPNPSLPLAAATLAALLSQYGKEPQCAAAVVAATNVLIPVHV